MRRRAGILATAFAASLAVGSPSAAWAQDEPDLFPDRTDDELPPAAVTTPRDEIGAEADPSADDDAPSAPRRKRPRAPYDADDVSPFARNELALTGSVIVGGAYFSTILVLGPQGFPSGTGPMMAPVVGPWITLAIRDDDGSKNEPGKRAFIAADGVIQGAGVLVLFLGQFFPVTDPMHSEGESFARVPIVDHGPFRVAIEPAAAGVRALGSF